MEQASDRRFLKPFVVQSGLAESKTGQRLSKDLNNQIETCMKQVIGILLALLLWLPGLEAMERRLIVASVPWRDTETLNRIYHPFISLLQQELSIPVMFVVTDDYNELAERLNTGAADIGILGGNSYVEAKERYPGIQYLSTAKQPTEMYFSLVVVHQASDITSLEGLRGRSFGFTDQGSTSGYVYPALLLSSFGIDASKDLGHVYFLQKHDKVYDAIAHRSIDAGGVSSTAYEKAVERHGDIFRIIGKSEPIPRNAFVAAAHLPAATVDRIREIMRAAENSPLFINSDSILKGFAIRDDSFYDIVRRARKFRK